MTTDVFTPNAYGFSNVSYMLSSTLGSSWMMVCVPTSMVSFAISRESGSGSTNPVRSFKISEFLKMPVLFFGPL